MHLSWVEPINVEVSRVPSETNDGHTLGLGLVLLLFLEINSKGKGPKKISTSQHQEIRVVHVYFRSPISDSHKIITGTMSFKATDHARTLEISTTSSVVVPY